MATFKNDLMLEARKNGRTAAEQLQHWASIGKAMEENQDISYAFFVRIQRSIKDVNAGHIEPYVFENTPLENPGEY